jgi:predicted flap endonuclease-1-like 5' DNA nuclease
MAFLVGQLFGWLLFVGLICAVSGWATHALRTGSDLEDKERERDLLRRDLVAMVNAELPTGDGERTIAAERELDTLRTRSEIQGARITELENHLLLARDQRDRDAGAMAELQRRLEAARTETVQVQPLALATDEDPEQDRRLQWRLKYFEARAAYLAEETTEQAVPALPAPVPLPDEALVADRDAARAGVAMLTARVAELEAALAKAPEPAPAFDAQPLLEEAAFLKDQDLRSRWHVRYLEARVKYLEDHAAPEAPPAPAQPVMVEVPAAPTAEALEQERRRGWRTRYLEARIAHLEGGRSQIQDLEGAIRALRAKVSELEGSEVTALELATQADAKANSESQRAEALQAQVRALEAALTEARAATPTLQTQAAQLASQRDSLRAERDSLQQELNRLRNAPPPRDPEADELRWRARYLASRVQHLESAPPPPAVAMPVPVPAPEPEVRLVPPGSEVRPEGLGAPRMGAPDDLRLIDGIGPKLESTLNALGIYHFDQIAAWTPANIAWVDQYLRFRGRIVREHWVEQARAIVSGASAGRLTAADENA